MTVFYIEVLEHLKDTTFEMSGTITSFLFVVSVKKLKRIDLL